MSGVCLATSRDAYKAIGGFDEGFVSSYSMWIIVLLPIHWG